MAIPNDAFISIFCALPFILMTAYVRFGIDASAQLISNGNLRSVLVTRIQKC